MSHFIVFFGAFKASYYGAGLGVGIGISEKLLFDSDYILKMSEVYLAVAMVLSFILSSWVFTSTYEKANIKLKDDNGIIIVHFVSICIIILSWFVGVTLLSYKLTYFALRFLRLLLS